MLGVQCETCGGTRHVAGPDLAVRRCPDCFNIVYDQRFIAQGLRGRERTYPAALDALPPWDPSDVIFVGGHGMAELPRFKHMAWRSLAAYRFANLRYEYLDLARLLEVALDKDGEYTERGTLYGLPLLILTVREPAHKKSDYAAGVLAQTLFLRREEGKGLWLFSPLTVAQIGEHYSYAVKDLLPPPRKAY